MTASAVVEFLRETDPSLAELVITIYKSLPIEIAEDWLKRICPMLTPGLGKSLVVDRWIHWQVSELANDSEHCTVVRDLYARKIAGNDPPAEEWKIASDLALIAMNDKDGAHAWEICTAWIALRGCAVQANKPMSAAKTARAALVAGSSTMPQRQADALERILGEHKA